MKGTYGSENRIAQNEASQNGAIEGWPKPAPPSQEEKRWEKRNKRQALAQEWVQKQTKAPRDQYAKSCGGERSDMAGLIRHCDDRTRCESQTAHPESLLRRRFGQIPDTFKLSRKR